MSQAAFLADLDSRLHAAFASCGMADVATYTPPAGSTATAAGTRRCYLNAGGQSIGGDGRVRAPRDVVAVSLADGAVEQGGTLVVGADTFALRSIDETDPNDRSLQYWVVRRG